jgi:hypothetical protein
MYKHARIERKVRLRALGSVFAITIFLLMASSVRAESVSWGSHIPYTLASIKNPIQDGSQCLPVLGESYASVQYAAQAVDPTTGASLCGATIPKGRQVRFEFAPHASTDIYWVGTGYAWDSPYGDWIAGAASPPIGEMCMPKNYYFSNGDSNFYASLSVDPPSKSITGTSALSCGSAAEDGSMTCSALNEGAITPVFNFAATQGHFYWAQGSGESCYFGHSTNPQLYTSENIYWPMDGTGWRYCYGNAPFTLSVPAQSISCPITIVDADGDAPGKPSVVATGSFQCVTGTPHSISVTATDPDGDDVRYGVDWDANGTVDQFLPSSGYAASGTTLVASRTYATTGAKTVKVIALDERGLTSGWATFSFSCVDPEGQGAGDGSVGGDGDGGISDITPNLYIRATPSLVAPGETTRLHWSASNVASCAVTGQNGDSFSGAVSDEPEGNETSSIFEQTVYTLACEDDEGNTLTQSATVNVLPVWSET